MRCLNNTVRASARTDFRRGQRLGQRDHLIVLSKPIIKPDWMSQAEYEQAPQTLTVRELRTGGKILVTTLLCPKHTDKAALKALYRSRWHVELDLRNIKTTLGMERLSCQTPAMAHQGNLGLSAGLQSDSPDDGPSRTCWPTSPAPTELQAHRADLDRLEQHANGDDHERQALRPVRPDRPAAGR